MTALRDQRSQALAEFALVAPVLLLILFGIVDLGRAVFLYNTIQHAAREGARVAVRDSTSLPTNDDVIAQVKSQVQFVDVETPCPNGPVVSTVPPPGVAWVYITEPNPPSSIESNPPMNAPGGEFAAAATGSCSAINPASGNAPLQVTIKYNFSLLTPIASQLAISRIVMTAAAVVNTEY